MVKLQFNPSLGKTCGIKSKTSKFETKELNPFLDEKSPFDKSSEIDIIKTRVELIGLNNSEYVIKKWYTDSLKELTKLLLIIGPIGCGKTTLIENICISLDIEVLKVNDSIKPKKDLLREIIIFTQHSYYSKNQNKLIFIDEYQNSMTDTLSITDISNLLNIRNHESLNKKDLKDLSNLFDIDAKLIIDLKLPPILIISSDSKGSKLSELKKNSEIHYINEIPKSIVKPWIKKIINFEIKESLLDYLINKCKSDIRLLLNTINFVKTVDSPESIDFFISSFYKDEDVNLFQFTEALFDKIDPIDISDIFKVYDTDGYLLANLVHENYIDYNCDIENIANSIDSISMGDTVFAELYDSTKNFNPEIHCVYSLYGPSVFSRSDVKKNKVPTRTSINNNRFNIYLNNKKIIDKIVSSQETNTTKFGIDDIYFIKKFITNELVKSKTFNKNQADFLRNILGMFVSENETSKSKIDKLELIYKHFNDFKDSTPKAKNFTIKFKEKLSKLV
jgi:ABC-type iron transport system FetAB ATPase subunit